MLRQWIEPEVISLPPDFADSVAGHPLVAQTLIRRGLKDIQAVRGFIDPACYQPASPYDLPDLDIAVATLTQAVQNGQKICVWGDFDVDGQTATALLVTALRRLKADVIYHIPVRSRESHGISASVLQEYLTQGIGLLLTCDTGIAAHQAIQLARQHDLAVIITDHHDLPAELPMAQAIINPRRLPPAHPLFTLPGVGVAYKLIEALYKCYPHAPTTDELLDLVAMGIVADLAAIYADTRYLLQLGLPILRQMPRLGLRMLAEVADLTPQNITEDHISFILAPRLNALGRLDDANKGVELLTTTDPLRARILAQEIEGLNANRRLLSEQVYQAAVIQLETDLSYRDQKIIILAHPTWPAGVIGIAAARLVERFQKPVVLFSSPPGELARGSARSVKGVDISAAIATQAHLLEGYGGHPMAAGLSINPDRIPDFKRGIARSIKAQRPANSPADELSIDGYITLKDISLGFVQEMERLAPFGQGNPPVTLAAQNLTLSGYSAVGKHGEHLLIKLEDELGYAQQAIWWNGSDQSIPTGTFDLAFTVRSINYRGQKSVQLEWINARPSGGAIPLRDNLQPIIEVFDFRSEINPFDKITSLLNLPEVQIWCESDNCPNLPTRNRLTLSPCSILIIWSPPPGPQIFYQALQATSPRIIYLLGNNTKMDQSVAFLKRLSGLCKYAINHHAGCAHLSTLAAATNQRLETVNTGLGWLQRNGYISIQSRNDNDIELTLGSGVSQPNKTVDNLLQSLLDESAAYRKYYLREDKDMLITNARNITPQD